MFLSTRQHALLSILLHGDSYATAEQLAVELDSSTRTVHRELKELEPILAPYGLGLVKKTGAGVLLSGTREAKDQLQALMLQDVKTVGYTPRERKHILLGRLLREFEPVKLLLLADEVNVTVATVASDLEAVEQWVEPIGLTLIRRRGYGIELTGTESDKRQAIYNLIVECMGESDRLALIHSGSMSRILAPSVMLKELNQLVAVKEMPRIDDLIRQLPIMMEHQLADVAYADLILHLAILIKRREQGQELDGQALAAIVRSITSQERIVADQIAQAMFELLNEPLTEAERENIALFIRGAQTRRVQQETEHAALEQAELHANMQQLVTTCEHELGIPFSKDKVLLSGLLAHLEPTIHRIRERHPVYNPHLKRIMEDYSELFQVIAKAMQYIMPNMSVPDDEIGFLVMHFAAAVERSYRLNRRIRAIVFCSSGIGTSKMLASRLMREIPEIEIVDNVSVFEVHLLDKSKYDIIISTVMLPIDPDRYIWVSPLLSAEELQRIKDKIELQSLGWQEMSSSQVTKTSIPRETGTVSSPDGGRVETVSSTNAESESGISVERAVDAGADMASSQLQEQSSFQAEPSAVDHESGLSRLKMYVDLSLAIVKQFKQYDAPPAETLEQVLLEICLMMEQEGVVSHADELANKLIQRQHMGGLGIPTTTLALMHARSSDVIAPTFRMFRLDKPLQLEAMDYSMMNIHDVLLMLSPEQVAPEAIEILSEISSFFIDSYTVECFATHDETLMRSHLEERLYAFCYNKMTRKGNNE